MDLSSIQQSVGSLLHEHHSDPNATATHSSVLNIGKHFMDWEIYVWMVPTDEGQSWPGRSLIWAISYRVSVWFRCWGRLVYLIPLKHLKGFQLVWGGTVSWNDNTLPQVLFSDASHLRATAFAILLNTPHHHSQAHSSPSMVPSSSHPPKPKALKCWICLLPPSFPLFNLPSPGASANPMKKSQKWVKRISGGFESPRAFYPMPAQLRLHSATNKIQ